MMTLIGIAPISVRNVLHFHLSAEQTMGMAAVEQQAVRRRGWTAAQVRDLIDESRAWPRYELIDGELLVTPAPRVAHQVAVMEIWKRLESYVKINSVGFALTSPADIELVAENITQPDVFVFPPAEPADAEQGLTWPDIKSLLLAIEIISPSSIRFDRIIKRDYYMDRAGVSEYWVVDLVAEIVERWSPSSKTPTIDRESLKWQPEGAESALVIDLKSLFEEIRVAARLPRRI
jgi:Uma2 family endonuclease